MSTPYPPPTPATPLALEPTAMLAAERAVDGGSALFRQGRSHVGRLIGKGDRDFASDVDVRIERAIREELAQSTPDIPFLGEEEDGVDPGSDRLWVLDPIDGTINFIKGSLLCGLSLALLERGRPRFAIVDLPLLGERYIAAEGGGAFLNGNRIAVAPAASLRDAVVGLTDFAVGDRAPAENRVHLALLHRLATGCLRVRAHGSAALDLAWLAAGRLNATVMLSNLPWDVSAGALLVREAGGLMFDQDGSDHGLGSRYTLAAVSGVADGLAAAVSEALAGA